MRLVIAERFNFHRRYQQPGESTAQHMAELRRLAKTCHFGQFLNDALRDQLVCGLIATNTQRHILSEADLAAEHALEISQAMEAVEKGAKVFKEDHQDSKQQGSEMTAINVVRKPVTNKARLSESGEGCTRCAWNGHLSWNCPYHGTVSQVHVRLDIWHEHAGQAVQKERRRIE